MYCYYCMLVVRGSYLVHHDGLIGSSPSLAQGKMKGEGEREREIQNKQGKEREIFII